MVEGAGWCVAQGYGWPEDLEHTEGRGCLPGADPAHVSARAMARGMEQLGHARLGQPLPRDPGGPPGRHPRRTRRATILGVEGPGQIFVMLHCGSRGFGHQIGTDYLRLFDEVMPRYGITVKDRELACAPFRSKEGQAYFGAMNAAANTAFANRQVITHRVREVIAKVFGKDARELGLFVVYDVCHNTAKLERHEVDGAPAELVVHRKGATRAFGPGAPDVPDDYREIGQPVIIGGSMETGSALLVGTAHAMDGDLGLDGARRRPDHVARPGQAPGPGRDPAQGHGRARHHRPRRLQVRRGGGGGLRLQGSGLLSWTCSTALGISRRVVSLTPIGNIKG